MATKFSHFLIAIFLLFLIASCGPNDQRADLVFLNGSEPESLDPAIITGQLEGRIASALFEGLLCRNPAGTPVAGVAETWELSPDGKTYTFHLRHNAKWSNGDPVTSADFVQSWERTLNPTTASEYAYQLFYIRNAEEYYTGKLKDFSHVGVQATDPYTLIVQLNNPTPFFLDLCAFPTLMPVHLPSVLRYGDDWIKPGYMISNGAFMLETWKINQTIRLRANPYYWDRDTLKIQTVEILPTNQANTAFNLYYSGAADLMLDKGLVPSILLHKLRHRPDFHSAPFLGTSFYRLNVTRPPFTDLRVRQAFCMVIDKNLLVDKITRAGETTTDTFVPPGIAGYQSGQGLPYQPEKARQLLAEAGYPGGKGFPEISILFNKTEQNEAIATEIQQMYLKELGVHVKLKQQEWKTYLGSMSSLDYEIARSSWVGDYNDPNTFLDMFVTGGGNNRTGWSNATYDELIRKAAVELDPAKRMKIFQEAETLLCAEAPILPLHYYVGIQFYDPKRVSGIEPNVLDEHPLKYIRVQKTP